MAEQELNDKAAESLMENSKPTGGMKRNVTLLGAVSIIVGTIIGSGIFASPAIVIIKSGSVGMALTIWCLCGCVSMLMSLCYIELGIMIPKSGAEYIYLKESFGELAAFLFSFSQCIVLKPASLAIVGITFGEYIVTAVLGSTCSEDEKTIIVKLLAAFCLGKLDIRIFF